MTLPDMDTLDTYGGELGDYGIGVVDPTTDRGADAANKAYASTAMMTRNATRCAAKFATHATTPTLTWHEACWGNSVPVAPTPARLSTGVFTLTWPTTVNDALAKTRTVALRWAKVMEVAGATAYHVQTERTAANVVTVRVFDMAGSAVDAAGLGISVEAG